MTLNDIREEMAKREPSKWSHSRIFEDVSVSLENKVPPSQFWERWSERDQAFAIARSRSVKTMEAWEHHLHEREMRKK